MKTASNTQNIKILGIDYGEKYTGLAFYCSNQTPFPIGLGRIRNQGTDHLIQSLMQVISDELIELIVVGISYYPDGNESTMTKKTKQFIKILEEKVEQKVSTIDESYSTFEAKKRMENSPLYNFKVDYNKIDEISATIILEDFIANPVCK
ncbi:Holliday junction resolvase RuvX [Bacteriovoracaceae bacterium]|nr:Holliday junction resolvase RuvX [Bacteriovoracaceae bacterium]